METDEFVERFETDELAETLEFVEWIGEYRLLLRLKERVETFRSIEFGIGD